MKFSVGYQLRPTFDWIDAILARREHVAEVYFAWPGFANGRSDSAAAAGFTPWEAQARIQQNLSRVADAGIPTNLLLNAMCYGAESQSRSLFNRIGDTLDYVQARLNTKSVTTTSPLIAKFIHANFPGVEVRASVNMEIGSVRAMRTVEDYFDGFYLRRELNRLPEEIDRMKRWCDETGHYLYFLVNSGCVADCAMHVFHDNLVAHEKQIAAMDNAYNFRGVCWERLSTPELRSEYLQNATFVRPEDLHLYEQWFSVAKLATRVNRDPVRVLDAYIAGSFRGSLPSLMEPNCEGAFQPDFLENSLIPEEYGRHVMECSRRCEECDYCRRVFEGALKRLV